MSQSQNRKEADRRITEASERFKEIQKTIAPYIRKPVVTDPKPAREWESSDNNITRIDQRCKI
jgi:hypothetical protein